MPAPEWMVPRGLPTAALATHWMAARPGSYLPFYRQAEIYRRQGIDPDCTMLANGPGRAALLLQPIIDAMIADLIGGLPKALLRAGDLARYAAGRSRCRPLDGGAVDGPWGSRVWSKVKG